MIALTAFALATLPAGGKIPEAFLGTYAFMEATKSGCDLRFAFVIRPDQIRLRGVDYPVLMEEAIDDNNIHIWLRDPVAKDNATIAYHLNRSPEHNGGIILVDENSEAEAAITYGTPPPDTGVDGPYDRCPSLNRSNGSN
ncbi:hypothetical protein [Sphingomonas sp.]|uniref:hypothetical protein n=1 Tax=Sphingomonas sp. TaxID=28214 RepID=UPI0025F16ECF|nr:hypothetical protein [Sphingomonas sp.]